MTQETIRIQQDFLADIEFSLETEKLHKPLLTRAGILDLNLAFSQVPEEIFQQLGDYPNFDGSIVYPFIFELRNEVERTLGVEEFRDPNFSHGHFMHPIIEGGLISDVAKTQLFQRIFGVHQLGPNRYYPLENHHNRGEHSIYVAVNAARTLQALYDRDKEGLVAKFREDFTKEGIPLPDTDEEVIFAGLDLAVTTCLVHDLATPAGGDTFKYLANLDEEENLGWLLSEDRYSPGSDKEEAIGVLETRGIEKTQQEYIIRCVQGKSETLIGEIVHPPKGDKMDHDRIGYTLLDSVAANIFDYEIPERFLPKQMADADIWKLYNALVFSWETLGDPEISATLGFTRDKDEGIFPVNIIDPSEDFSLDPKGELVCTNPQKLSWVAAIRTCNVGMHYAGFKLLGLEYELQRRLQDLRQDENLARILSKENLLNFTDNDLYSALGEIEDEELQTILERRAGIASTTLFEARLAPVSSQLDPEAFASFPMKIKPGLESLVKVDGATLTLEDYLYNNGEPLPIDWLIRTMRASMEQRRWDIYKRSD
jgi:hypothetical protein